MQSLLHFCNKKGNPEYLFIPRSVHEHIWTVVRYPNKLVMKKADELPLHMHWYSREPFLYNPQSNFEEWIREDTQSKTLYVRMNKAQASERTEATDLANNGGTFCPS